MRKASNVGLILIGWCLTNRRLQLPLWSVTFFVRSKLRKDASARHRFFWSAIISAPENEGQKESPCVQQWKVSVEMQMRFWLFEIFNFVHTILLLMALNLKSHANRGHFVFTSIRIPWENITAKRGPVPWGRPCANFSTSNNSFQGRTSCYTWKSVSHTTSIYFPFFLIILIYYIRIKLEIW